MRYVGDVHLQLPVAVFETLHVHRIVEVARRFAVDRDNRQISEIAPPGALGIAHGMRRAGGFRQHFRRKFVREMMFPDQDLDVHAEIAGATENFDHASGRGDAAARKASHLHVYDGAIKFRQTHATLWLMQTQLPLQLRHQFIARRNDDFLQQARFVRRNRISARSVPEQSHNRCVRAADHAQNASLGAAWPGPVAKALAALDAREHVIAVHRVADCIAPDEKIAVQIFSRRIRHDETVTIAVRDEAPRQLIRFRPHRRARFGAGFRAMLRAVALRRAFLRRLREMRALFFFRQTNAPVGVFVNFPVLLQFSRELHQRAASRMAQTERRRDFAKVLWLAGSREMCDDLGFGDRCARLIRAWHRSGHCMRSSGKTRNLGTPISPPRRAGRNTPFRRMAFPGEITGGSFVHLSCMRSRRLGQSPSFISPRQ